MNVYVRVRNGDTRETDKKGGYWELWETKSCSFLIEPSGPGTPSSLRSRDSAEGKPGVLGKQS